MTPYWCETELALSARPGAAESEPPNRVLAPGEGRQDVHALRPGETGRSLGPLAVDEEGATFQDVRQAQARVRAPGVPRSRILEQLAEGVEGRSGLLADPGGGASGGKVVDTHALHASPSPGAIGSSPKCWARQPG